MRVQYYSSDLRAFMLCCITTKVVIGFSAALSESSTSTSGCHYESEVPGLIVAGLYNCNELPPQKFSSISYQIQRCSKHECPHYELYVVVNLEFPLSCSPAIF